MDKTFEQDFQVLESEFAHTPRGLEIIRKIKAEFFNLMFEKQKFEKSIRDAYSKPHTTIQEEL